MKDHIPYKKFVPRVIKCTGLPIGEQLKYPSKMSTSLLNHIKENQDLIDINFNIEGNKFYD